MIPYLGNLFARSRKDDPQTSKDAGQSITMVAPKHYQTIHEALKDNGPMGKDGIAYVTGLDGNQIARRLPEMQKLGMVKLTGQTVESLSGRKEREWSINE